MQLVVTVEHVNDPVEDVTVYDVMALPPLLVGAVQETVIDESPNAVVAEVGLEGMEGVVACKRQQHRQRPRARRKLRRTVVGL